MRSMIYCFLLFMVNIVTSQAHMVHQKSPIAKEWKEEDLRPFSELIISWNAVRPTSGKLHFYVSVKTDEWSPWLAYASWGTEEQSSDSSGVPGSPVTVYQDTLTVAEGKQATGFQIKVVAEGDAYLEHVRGLHVYINSDKAQGPQELVSNLPPVHLKVSGLSQMALDHVRHADLCSPTSTTAVTRYLTRDPSIDPVDFAQKVWDARFDIFGNWVFNVAQASTYLGGKWDCWVERLRGFESIHHYLQKGTPVVVSIRGPLTGSALPYAKGHLVVVVGYDPLEKKILCMDPAFPSNEETHVAYDSSDFILAWSRRGNLAYIFSESE